MVRSAILLMPTLGRTAAVSTSCALIVACAACTSAGIPTDYIPAPEYAIIAYVRDSDQMDLESVDARRLTHINYAFADVSPDHRIYLRNASDGAALRKLTGLRSLNPDLKVLVSAGGWSWSDHFSDAALTDESRRIFAESAARIIRDHDLDGIDLDWEYPGQPGDGNTHRPEDRENFTLMIRDVRERLDALEEELERPLLLTIAAGAGQSFLDHTQMEDVASYLDYVNLMTYDFAGPWTPTTAHHTNLYDGACAGESAEAGVKRYVDAGVPREKIVLGAAFYGRSWEGVEMEGTGLCRPYTGASGTYTYATLEREYIDRNGYRRYWDHAAHAPYLANPDSAEVISYDDPASIQFKALFIREKGLRGAMFWVYNSDPSGTLLRTLHSYLAVPE